MVASYDREAPRTIRAPGVFGVGLALLRPRVAPAHYHGRRMSDFQPDPEPSPEPDAAWSEFRGRLATAIERMPAESYLVLTTAPDAEGHARYVQFARGASGLRAEAVSSHFLPAGVLSPGHETRLRDLGWEAPPPDGPGRNFHRDWPWPAPAAVIADLTVATLRTVYEVAAPSDLQYVHESFAHEPVESPDLGIAERPKTPQPARKPWRTRAVNDLGPLVEDGLRRWLGVEDLVRDDDGDYPCRVGSAMVYIRLVDGVPPVVVVFSPILRDIAESPELVAALNEVNSRIRFGRVFWAERTVLAATELTAVDITADQVALACLELGNLADVLDGVLHGRFGGRPMFESTPKLMN